MISNGNNTSNPYQLPLIKFCLFLCLAALFLFFVFIAVSFRCPTDCLALSAVFVLHPHIPPFIHFVASQIQLGSFFRDCMGKQKGTQESKNADENENAFQIYMQWLPSSRSDKKAS